MTAQLPLDVAPVTPVTGVTGSAIGGSEPAAGRTSTPGRPLLEFFVFGKPQPQGSKTKGRYGNIRDDNAERLAPWRDAVTGAAIRALTDELGVYTPLSDTADVTVPVAVSVVFTFAKPLSAPKRRRLWPTRRSTFDLDKLTRACFDALTDSGAWRDDSQVVELHARKVYVDNADPGAMQLPGAHIRVYAINGAD